MAAAADEAAPVAAWAGDCPAVLSWLAAVVLGWPAVVEVAAPTAEGRPPANAVEAPKAHKTARKVTRASTPARRADERARRRFIAS